MPILTPTHIHTLTLSLSHTLSIPHPHTHSHTHSHTLSHSQALYGATGGQLFANGRAGERFAVRIRPFFRARNLSNTFQTLLAWLHFDLKSQSLIPPSPVAPEPLPKPSTLHPQPSTQIGFLVEVGGFRIEGGQLFANGRAGERFAVRIRPSLRNRHRHLTPEFRNPPPATHHRDCLICATFAPPWSCMSLPDKLVRAIRHSEMRSPQPSTLNPQPSILYEKRIRFKPFGQ